MYTIKGEIGKVFKVFQGTELILYSENKTNWFSNGKINVYDSKGNLILEVEKNGVFKTDFQILHQNEEFFQNKVIIYNNFWSTELAISNDLKILLKGGIIPFITRKIYCNNLEIGKVKMNAKLFERNYNVDFKSTKKYIEFMH